VRNRHCTPRGFLEIHHVQCVFRIGDHAAGIGDRLGEFRRLLLRERANPAQRGDVGTAGKKS